MSTFCLGRTYCSESLLFAQKLYFMDGWVFVSLVLCIFEVVGRSVSILCHLQKMVSWPRCRYCNPLFPVAWQFWDFQILLSDRLVISWMRQVCWAHGDTVNILAVLPQWFCFINSHELAPTHANSYEFVYEVSMTLSWVFFVHDKSSRESVFITGHLGISQNLLCITIYYHNYWW